ncbi:glycosyltransferase family 4 protein [Longimicrobium sp.]|uniref:glycosyltransferase family 4 protein n=1 Tax=Longimicrobium sp. TaxID=2029185 RepID=UPI002E348AE2|nr:glycosyltransferase family 4 protein [Longimicrobium sp.]HEX6042119.1 glycosyltransferase family 4 protein [Longimicrobium sp.]
MRILLVGDYPADPRLGSAKVYYKLREEFSALGHDCDVLLEPDIAARPRNWRVRQTVSPWLAERAIRRAFREGGPYDVVDVASAEGMVLAARRRMGFAREPVIVSRSHGLEHLNYARTLGDAADGLLHKPWTRRLWYPGVRLPQVAAAARLSDALIVLNPGDADFAVHAGWLSAERVHVVPHGVSARFLADAPAPDAPRGGGVLFCGSWDNVKGTPYLARAMGLLAADGAAPRLTVLGPGVPEDVVLASFPAEARPYVRVVPRAPEDAVMREYRAHDMLVACSTYEGFGMVIVEAMSQRLPVVATPVGCASMLIRDGDNGVLVPPRDPAALAAALRRVMRDTDVRREMGDRAAASVAHLTWRATAERTLEVYGRASRG